MNDPLPMEYWNQRWKVTRKWDVLHRVARIDQVIYDSPKHPTSIMGATCCGIEGHLVMPGIFSRLGLPRCPTCCQIAKVIEGGGMPGNYGIDESIPFYPQDLNEWVGP